MPHETHVRTTLPRFGWTQANLRSGRRTPTRSAWKPSLRVAFHLKLDSRLRCSHLCEGAMPLKATSSRHTLEGLAYAHGPREIVFAPPEICPQIDVVLLTQHVAHTSASRREELVEPQLISAWSD
jgi:hypothetical protein